jgi:MFS transporter, FSR family, fosmidomycin resistance protein
MALSRTTRVNLLIGNGHFLSHFYSLCLPPLFLAWKSAFHISFAEVGLAVALMSGASAIFQTPVGFLVDRHGARRFLIGGALLMSLCITAMGFATSFWQILVLAPLSGMGNSVFHPADYAILSGSVDKDRMGRSFALHTFSGNLGFAAAPPVMALLLVTTGWRTSLILVGLLGVPVAISIILQSGILRDQVRHESTHTGPAISGRELLTSRTMLLFFGFFLLGSMAGSGVQSWLITVLHTVRGMALEIASSALTAYMAGSTVGVLVGGWFADAYKRHVLAFAVVLTIASAALTLVVGWAPVSGLAVVGLMFASGLALGASRTLGRSVLVVEKRWSSSGLPCWSSSTTS